MLISEHKTSTCHVKPSTTLESIPENLGHQWWEHRASLHCFSWNWHKRIDSNHRTLRSSLVVMANYLNQRLHLWQWRLLWWHYWSDQWSRCYRTVRNVDHWLHPTPSAVSQALSFASVAPQLWPAVGRPNTPRPKPWLKMRSANGIGMAGKWFATLVHRETGKGQSLGLTICTAPEWSELVFRESVKQVSDKWNKWLQI